MAITYLQTADGTQYSVRLFHRRGGIVDVDLVLSGVQYPAVERWYDCMLVLGDTVFEHMNASITDVRIKNPLNGVDLCTTEYALVMWPMRPPTPDDAQEADAAGKV